MWTTLSSRGAIAVYGTTATLLTFTSRQKYVGISKDLQQKLFAEEAKVTEATKMLRDTQIELEKVRENMNLALKCVPPVTEPVAPPPTSANEERRGSDEAMSMALGVVLGGFFGVLGSMGGALR